MRRRPMDIKANEIKKSVGMSLLTFHSTMKDNPEFSNFYPHTKYTTVPFEGFNFKNKRFTSVEIFFQYYKFKLMNTSVGNAYAQAILNSSDSLTAKKLERSWPKPTFWTLGGQNMLGKLLMLIRDRIIRVQSDDNTRPSTDYDIELE